MSTSPKATSAQGKITSLTPPERPAIAAGTRSRPGRLLGGAGKRSGRMTFARLLRTDALGTSPAANRSAAVSPMGGCHSRRYGGLHGRTEVEGYPEPAGSVPAGFLYHGALSSYERLGFVRDRQIGKHRWVVTKVVEPGS